MKNKRIFSGVLAVSMAVTLTVCSASAAATGTKGTYTVAQGDSLWSISSRLLGAGKRWTELYEANKNIIRSPGLIFVGQVLTVPGVEQTVETPDDGADTAWQSTPLSFSSPMVVVVGGTLSWNTALMQWKAEFPTPYGATTLGGTYTKDGVLTLIDDSTGGYGKNDIPAIQAEFSELLAGWQSAPLSFSNNVVSVTGGRLSWNPNTVKWKAVFSTTYGETKLGGTYDNAGTLTLIDDSTGGHGGNDVPAIQGVLIDALAGWRHAPLAYQGAQFKIAGGTLSWNSITSEWKAQYPTPYGATNLSGTYDEQGVLVLVNDSTGGHAGEDVPAIQNVFQNAVKGIYAEDREASMYPPNTIKLPGNADKYAFKSLVPMKNSPLQKANVCILGSSVVYGINSMGEAVGEYLAARFDCALTKEAISGTTLVDNGEKSYIQRMLKNLDTKANFDLFICQLSTNDATQKMPLGEIAEGMELESFDTATVTGAMEYIIGYAKKTWGCPVVFFTGSHYESQEYDAMVKRAAELKDKWGIEVLDLWNDKEFNDISEENRALYMYDEIHPTKAGYREWWGVELEQQLLKYLEK